MPDFPSQRDSMMAGANAGAPALGNYDMREHLDPRRLTLAMWDQAYLLRHVPGESFEHYDRVLDETLERGYNTLRLDPLPQIMDLSRPEQVLSWPDPQLPNMPWGWKTAVTGPAGLWLIEFMEKLLQRRLHYALSAWWFTSGTTGVSSFPSSSRTPRTHLEAAELWVTLLTEWRRRFGFEGLVYVDLVNETPFFLPGFMDRLKQETGVDWFEPPRLTARQIEFMATELNGALALVQREFPDLRFTSSIHGDERWLDVPVQFDCLDVHFYSEADVRWNHRTRFKDFIPHFFGDTAWHKEFSDRCTATLRSVAPMLRARQRSKVASFSAWGARHGMPLTTSESWASWYYIDSPDLDWGWLLEWAAWSVEDAIEFKMWGWTPHNYVQPQFVNWRDARWHRRLTDKFLKS